MCQITAAATTRLPPEPSAARLARAFLRGARCPAHHASVLDDAELLTSELVTNAVMHGAPPVTISVECDTTEGMRIRVTDGSTRRPAPRDAAPADLGGRGMALVDLLSAAWGAEPTECGKEVWFLLRAPSDARADAPDRTGAGVDGGTASPRS